jgi:hypothetical protein
MTSPRVNEGERIAGLEAKFDAFEQYERERWHKQDRDLQLLVGLPTQIARENGKMQGEISALITAAVEKALEPVMGDIALLKTKVEALEVKQGVWSGAKLLGVWLIQIIISAMAVIFAMRNGMK